MEQGKFFSSAITLLILTIIAYIFTIGALFSVFAGNIFIFSSLIQFCGYLGTLLLQAIGNFFILVINGLSFIFTRNWNIFPLIAMGVPNFNLFTSFYRSIFIIFLISSICFLIYFVISRNSNWSIVSFIFIVMIILMGALTPIFVQLFDSFFMNWFTGILSSRNIYDIIGLSISIIFIGLIILFSISLVDSIRKKKMVSVLYFFVILISAVFLNTFARSYFPDFLFITIELSNISLSIQLKPYIYQILLSAFYLSSLIPADIQYLIGLLIYVYYFTPISTYLVSPEFLSAFFALLFLELSFQTTYFQEVYFPTKQRGSRLQKQINSLEKRIEKIKKTKTGEEKEEKEEIHSISVQRFFSSEAFDYLREMMEKRKKLEKPQLRIKEKEELFNDEEAQHLQLYIEERFKQNLQAKRSLAAEAVSPNISKVLESTVLNIIYRLITLLFLTFVLFNAANIFYTIGAPNIRQSVELLSPTIIALILFPIVLIFPVIGSIIKIRRLPKEQPRKSGIVDLGFGILGLTIGIIFIIIGAITFISEFYWISVLFWIFGGFELIFGIIQLRRPTHSV